MVLTPSTMLPLGSVAPDFSLPDVVNTGTLASPSTLRGDKGLLVMFICQHCPFVKHIQSELAKLGQDYQGKGINLVGISANDVANYPDDSPEKLNAMAGKLGFNFPLLYDESQAIAKAYKAACTPDFFLFDQALKLVYRGQLDDSRPGNNLPVDGKDLRKAMDLLLEDQPVPPEQKPSIGCNIKWKPGNEPDY